MAKTKSGFKYELLEERLNNFELLEAFSDLEENPMLLPKVVKMLLGEEQTKALYDHVRTDEGTVPIERIEAEISEMIESKKLKN